MPSKTIIITGASSGIGYYLALILAQPNTNLVLAARNLSALNQLAELCNQKGANTLVVPTNVADEKDCKNLINKTIQHFNSIHILINNAGISFTANFDEITDTDIFKKIIDTNYLGTVFCTFYALPYLKLSKGLIVGISSLQGLTGFPKSAGYAASKFAMQGFLDSLRIELNGIVDVLVVLPGAVDTDIHQKKLTDSPNNVLGQSKFSKKGLMPVDTCVKAIKTAIDKRQRQLIFTTQGKLIPLLRIFAPKLVDSLVKKAVDNFYK